MTRVPLVLPALLCFALSAPASELTAQQLRGKRLYLTGEGTKAKATALIGAEDVVVPASVVPCASCHGRDGRGNAEGGVRPANVQWDVLLRAVTSEERQRAAYTEPLLKRAIAMGVDSSSQRLQTTMPRYRLALDDMNDLLAYLQRVGSDRDPGISDDALRIGVVLPVGEEAPLRAAMSAYFARINNDGGVFGRRIDARFVTSGGTPAERAASLQRFVNDEKPFAIAGAFLNGADEAMSAALERAHVPAIAAFASRTPRESRYVFQLLAGVREQSLALLAATKDDTGALTIVADESTNAVATQLHDELAGRAVTIVTTTPPTITTPLVLYLGAPSRIHALLEVAAAAPKPPAILIPAPHSSGELTGAPPQLDRKIFVALPSSPADVTEEGRAELDALHVDAAHATSCRIALASAHLLVDALRHVGRDLDRETIVDTLDTNYRTATTLTPPISWSPNHHTGTSGALVMMIDLVAKEWVDEGWFPPPPS